VLSLNEKEDTLLAICFLFLENGWPSLGLCQFVTWCSLLAIQGHEHYLRLGEAGTITLHGPARPPGWLGG
jgi:hypothetical protein